MTLGTPSNRVLQRAGAQGSGLRSRGRAPMLVEGWRGRSAPRAPVAEHQSRYTVLSEAVNGAPHP